MQTLWSLERERVCFFCLIFIVAVVQSLSSVWLLVTPWAAAHQPFLCLWLTAEVCSNSCLLIWWCHPTTSSSVAPFSFCCQSFLASVSFPVSQLSHQMAKVLELQYQFSNEYSGLISFRTDWFDLLAVQGTFRSLLHSSPPVTPWLIFSYCLCTLQNYKNQCSYLLLNSHTL